MSKKRGGGAGKRLEKIVAAEAVIIIVLLVLWFVVTKDSSGSHKTETKKDNDQVQEVQLTTEGAAGAETETEAPTEPTYDLTTKEGRAASKGLPAPPEIDIDSWEYVLVNATHTIDDTFAPEIGDAYSQTSSTPQDARIVEKLNKFAADTEAQGLSCYLSSGYRSYWDQSYLYDLKCQEYPPEVAATIVAPPGTSEHQTGLCCDITDIYRSPKNSELENTETYKWMYAHCAEYGFILRFPKDKEDVTGIIYEPWHFRYVGEEAAKYIMDNGLCLEEFVALYRGDDYVNSEIKVQ